MLVRKLSLLSGSARRSAYALAEDAIAIVEKWGVKNTLFLLLTFGGGKKGPTVPEAEAAFHSFLTHVLAELFNGGIKVLERGELNGRVHFHLLVNAGVDVWTGADFAAIERKDYGSLNAACRRAWAKVQTERVKYGFGKIGFVLPIKSTAEGVARYVSKYIAKHVAKRRPEDKRARFRGYWGTARAHRTCTLKFSWAGVGGWLWRHKLAGFSKLNGIKDSEGWKHRLGPRWAYHIKDYVLDFPLEYWPTAAHARADSVGPDEEVEQEIRQDAVGYSQVRDRRQFDAAVDIRCPGRLKTAKVKQAILFGRVVHWLDAQPDFGRPGWVQEMVDRSRAVREARNPREWVRIMKDGMVTRGGGTL